MRVREKTEEPKFHPVKIEIILESEEEIAELWHRLNISKFQLSEYIKEQNEFTFDTMGNSSTIIELWRIIDSIADNKMVKL